MLAGSGGIDKIDKIGSPAAKRSLPTSKRASHLENAEYHAMTLGQTHGQNTDVR